MSEPSPRPWSNDPGDGRVFDASGKLVLMAVNPEKPDAEHIANLQLVIAAVNAFSKEPRP